MSDDVSFTDRELEVMSILWEMGSGTVREVMERFPTEARYTTILKFLQILEEKGHVRHELEGARTYRYFPTVPPDGAGGSALGRVVDKFFHGAADLALARLVEQRDFSAEEIARMRRILDDIEGRDAPGDDEPRSDSPSPKGGPR